MVIGIAVVAVVGIWYYMWHKHSTKTVVAEVKKTDATPAPAAKTV